MNIKEISSANFKDEVINSKIPVLVDFNATWCGPCKMLKPILEELSDEVDNYKIVSIDVDNNEELAREYKIFSIPCLIVIKKGKEIKRNVGFVQKDSIEEMMGDI